MIARLKTLYGQHGKLTGSRGKRHRYLGMTLDYSKKGKVIIDMMDYTKETHDIFPEDLSGKISTPANKHLFNVRDDAEKLEEGQRQTFHTIVSRSLFLVKQGRPGLQPTVAFVCTRVKEADLDNWKQVKEAHVIHEEHRKGCFNTEGRQYADHKMVDGRVIRNSPGLLKPNRCNNVIRNWFNIFIIAKKSLFKLF